MPDKLFSRRDVLGRLTGAAGAAASFPFIVPSSVFSTARSTAPSDRITLGFIGTGSQGIEQNLKNFIKYADAQVLAVCDVDTERREQAKSLVDKQYGNTACAAYNDFREILQRKDIDAVVISTPDHWHAIISIMAAKAGKDVFCEKPTVTIEEGRAVSDVITATKRVFQTGTEDRSIPVYHRMAELVRNGRIGKLHTIRVGLPAGIIRPAVLDQGKTYTVPEGFDYEMWLGPAPKAPYNPARCHFNFRYVSDYAGGILPDWGAHLLDTAQWGNDTEHSGPAEITGMGLYPHDGLYDTAYEYYIEYHYASGVRMIVRSGSVFLRFEGTDGWVGNTNWRGKLEASSDEILNSTIEPNETHLFTCPEGEQRNFLDCVKSRQDPYFPAEIGHRCCTVAHLGNIAMRLKRPLRWDPAKEEFINDEEANRLRSRQYRSPWKL
ncbi:MAG: Gfo/Idh/MocA family oxidoreductase [Patescibacteria group bacterium]|nr:Gfo/Idh/MocA family oxidoreductase [Patescibacteria group bacterium]